MSRQQNQQQQGYSNQDAFNFLYLFCRGHATVVTPFLRTGFGAEALGLNALVAFVMMTFLACKDQAMSGLLGLWLLAVIVQRVRTRLAIHRGEIIHSRYAGYPWLAMKMPFVRKEQTAVGIVEPMVIFLVGVLLCPLSVDVGGLVSTSAVSLMLQHGIEAEIDRKRMQQMRDAEIEQRYYAERFRNPLED
jgi:hypothetical protein